MNPDRRAGIRLHRNPDRNPVAGVALASLIAVGSTSYLPPLLEKVASRFPIPTTPVAEAFTPNCRAGLGVTVDNEAFSKGARVIVVEDLNGSRITAGRLKVGEEVLVVFEGPSNALKNGRDARQIGYFATDVDGRRVSPNVETTVTCGRFEHIKSLVEETQGRETPSPSRTATPASGSTPPPSATPTPDRVAILEARLQEMIAKATRTADDEKLARQARAEGVADAKATIEAERRAAAEVTKLIKEAEERGKREALVTPTAGVSGKPGVGINLPAKLPVEGMPDGASLAAAIASIIAAIAALGLVFDRPTTKLQAVRLNRPRTRLWNTLRWPDRKIRHVAGHPGIWGV